MTLQSSGPMTVAEIAAEMGKSLPITIPDADTRTLTGIAVGPLVIPTDFYGKSWKAAGFIGVTQAIIGSDRHTFSGVSIGDASSSRRVVVGVHWQTGASSQTLSSATIAGTAATIHRQSSHSGGSTGLGTAIISAAISSGTTANIALTFSGSVNEASIGVTRLVGLSSGTPHATQALQGVNNTNVSGSISVPNSGILVMAGTGSSNTTAAAITFTGGTEAYDDQMANVGRRGGTVNSGLSAETRTIGMQQTAANSGVGLIAVSWA